MIRHFPAIFMGDFANEGVIFSVRNRYYYQAGLSAGWQCAGTWVLKGGICHFAKWQIPPFNTEVSHPIIYPSSQVQRLVYKQPFLLGLSFCPWRPRHGWIRTGLPGSSHTCWRAFRIVPFPPDQYHLDFSAEDAGKQKKREREFEICLTFQTVMSYLQTTDVIHSCLLHTPRKYFCFLIQMLEKNHSCNSIIHNKLGRV